MDIIIKVIKLGSLLGIGFYIGFAGIQSLLELLALGIKLIVNKTLETKNVMTNGAMSGWPRRTSRAQITEKIQKFFCTLF